MGSRPGCGSPCAEWASKELELLCVPWLPPGPSPPCMHMSDTDTFVHC